jgi:hypothetical protein
MQRYTVYRILSGNCSTCFGWYLHPSSGAQTTVSTAPGVCHTVTATYRSSGVSGDTSTHHQERKQLYLHQTVTATCRDSSVSGDTSTHHQERKQLYLQHLLSVRPRLPPPAPAVLRVIPPPIIRSANDCIYSIRYLSDRYCYLPR